jgi:hypothetical protein
MEGPGDPSRQVDLGLTLPLDRVAPDEGGLQGRELLGHSARELFAALSRRWKARQYGFREQAHLDA